MDLTVDFTDIRDESSFDRAGGLVRVRRYTFYLGKHGPFIERVPLDQAQDAGEITRRVDALKRQLSTLPS